MSAKTATSRDSSRHPPKDRFIRLVPVYSLEADRERIESQMPPPSARKRASRKSKS